MPEKYTPPNSDWPYTVPADTDIADGPKAFRDFADSVPIPPKGDIAVKNFTAAHTIEASDADSFLVFDTTGGNLTCTVPNDSTLNLPVGTMFVICNRGSKTLTLRGAAGVVVQDKTMTGVAQWKMLAAIKAAANLWVVNVGGGATPVLPFNDATGGVVTEYQKGEKWYRAHTFTKADTFTVNESTRPWRLLCVAGGGGGAGRAGNNAQGAQGGSGGAGGTHEWFDVEFPVGSYPVTVGGGGNGGDGGGQGCQGANGGDSSIWKYLTHGGGGGGIATSGRDGGSGGGGGSAVGNWGGPWGGGQGMAGEGNAGTGGGGQGSGGAGGTVYYKTDITGTEVTVSPGSYGSGGGGENFANPGHPGQQGVVIVAYEIAAP